MNRCGHCGVYTLTITTSSALIGSEALDQLLDIDPDLTLHLTPNVNPSVVAWDWDCTLSTMRRQDGDRHDGGDHSEWVAQHMRELVDQIRREDRIPQAIVSHGHRENIVESLCGAGLLNTVFPEHLVITPRDFRNKRVPKSRMLVELARRLNLPTETLEDRARIVLVDDATSNVDDVRGAGFGAIKITAPSDQPCGGVACLLKKK